MTSNAIRRLAHLARLNPFKPYNLFTGPIVYDNRYLYRWSRAASGPILERTSPGAPGVWDIVATTRQIITALAGAPMGRRCARASINSLFSSGGTISEWEAFCQIMDNGGIIR